MKHLVVTEGFGSLPIKPTGKTSLTAKEADELEEHVVMKGLDSANILISRTKAKFINYVGYIQLSTCSIEILPKVRGNNVEHSRRVLIRLLNRTGFTKINESEIGDLSLLKESLLEILGFFYAKKLSKELKKGLYQYYVVENDNLQRIRGKINIKEQIQNSANRSTSVSCQYDNFTTDNPLNQIFKATIMVLIRNISYSETQRLLRHEMGVFDEVSTGYTPSNTFDLISFHRNNQRFYESFLLAKLILSGMASTSNSGSARNFSILFKMNELFEEYISVLVKQITPDVTVKERKYKLLVNKQTGRKNFLLEPDLVIRSKFGGHLIIDTKWKRFDPTNASHGVQRSDLYQMYAYLTRYKLVQTVVLLYPYGHSSNYKSGACLNVWNLDDDENKKIKCYTVNIEDERQALKELRGIISCNKHDSE
jgi:5-methylcytosine-specific restriction enzyme subunit McrC